MKIDVVRWCAWASICLVGMVAACGGNDDEVVATAPTPVIQSPADGATFRAGAPLTFSASATDAKDGALDAAKLTWWVDLHHDAHSHPVVQPTPGAGGGVTLPTRAETSDNIFLRFHLRATNSAGMSAEVTRDLLPQKAQITVAAQPAGLQLTLDGQPFAAPRTLTGVVGVERDLGAASQVFNGRIYQFSTWSDGGAASHAIATPATNTTYTAVFIDTGPAVNAPPSVALTAPTSGSAANMGTPVTLTADASDSDGTIASVQFFDGTTAIGTADTAAPYTVSWTPATTGAHALTARATDDRGASVTSAAVSVTVNPPTANDTQPPTVNITSPGALADGLTGSITFSANASDNVGVANVEFQIDSVSLATDTSSPYSATVDTTVHASGQHVLRARASDAAGNQSAWSSVLVRFGGTRATPAGFARQVDWTINLQRATTFTQLTDGRVLVAEQGGALRVVQSDGSLVAAPMLSVTTDASNERGLVGVAAHPNFASNGFVYIYYTTTQGGTHNRISRFTANGNTAGGEVVLVDLPPLSGGIHNGGAMHFGPDGKLYVAVGENANAPLAQDLTSPMGKMLRLNDDGTIPSDNPFCTTQGNLACAVWARGLRNPFTFAIQPGTGRMHINDVGQAAWEEINVGAAGANYGWPTTEGPTNANGITAPLIAYPHDEPAPPGSGSSGFINGICIIGGDFYPNSGPFPAQWRGGYFFADFGTWAISYLDFNNGNAVYAFGSVTAAPVAVMVANDGALLVLSQGAITRFTRP